MRRYHQSKSSKDRSRVAKKGLGPEAHVTVRQKSHPAAPRTCFYRHLSVRFSVIGVEEIPRLGRLQKPFAVFFDDQLEGLVQGHLEITCWCDEAGLGALRGDYPHPKCATCRQQSCNNHYRQQDSNSQQALAAHITVKVDLHRSITTPVEVRMDSLSVA